LNSDRLFQYLLAIYITFSLIIKKICNGSGVQVWQSIIWKSIIEGFDKLIIQGETIYSGHSGYRPTPFSERTYPDVPIVLCPDKMAAKVKQISHSGM